MRVVVTTKRGTFVGRGAAAQSTPTRPAPQALPAHLQARTGLCR